MSSKYPPSNQRPAGTRAQRSANPYAAAAAYAAADKPGVFEDDGLPPPGFGLGAAGPRPIGALGPQPGRPPEKPRRRKVLSLPNIRLLPVTIVVVGLTLAVRVNDIWRDLADMNLGFNLSEAQQPPPPGGRQKGQKPAALPADPVAASGTSAALTAPAQGDRTAQPAAPVPLQTADSGKAGPGNADIPPAVPAQNGSGGEPPTFTQNELDVLQKLSERRETLDSRERDLELRENLVKAAEARIDKKIAEMKSMQTSVEGMLKQVDDQDDAKMKSLAQMYESMKPKDAGKIFDQLDIKTLLGVVPRMKEQKAGQVIANMSPERAKDLTDALAQRRSSKAEGLPPLN